MAQRSQEIAPFRTPRGHIFLHLGNRAVCHLFPLEPFRPPCRPPPAVEVGGDELLQYVAQYVPVAREPFPGENLDPVEYATWYLTLGCEYRRVRPGVTAGSMIINNEKPVLPPDERSKLVSIYQIL